MYDGVGVWSIEFPNRFNTHTYILSVSTYLYIYNIQRRQSDVLYCIVYGVYTHTEKRQQKEYYIRWSGCRYSAYYKWNTRRTKDTQTHAHHTHCTNIWKRFKNSKWRHQSALGLVILCVSLHNITQFFSCKFSVSNIFPYKIFIHLLIVFYSKKYKYYW